MGTRARHTERRADALSRERIVEAAVELLDTAGESGLTFRVLTERLATGPGAIYWHVANKGELLGAATDAVVTAALAPAAGSPREVIHAPREAVHAPREVIHGPREVIHTVALGLFDAVDEHPWLAAQLAVQLSHHPAGPVTPRIVEAVGRPVHALGVPAGSRFTATFALVHYILGAASQNAVNGAHGFALGPGVDRGAHLDTVATAWEALDPGGYPFTRAVAAELREHDDRAEFLAGLDLVLTGITTVHPPAS